MHTRKFQITSIIFIVAIFCFNVFNASAGSVSLDTSFNNTGYKIEQIPGFDAFGESIAIQPDGKIVLGGSISNSSSANDFVLIRLNPDGSLDTNFDGDGIVITDFGFYDRADTIRLQPDGKILVAGNKYSLITNNDLVVVRYNADGSLDTDFGINGEATTNVRDFSDEHCYDMILQNDGKILLAGTTAEDSGSQTGFLLARFSSNGKLDKGFGNSGGKAIYYLSALDASATGTSAFLHPDGKIDFGGHYSFGTTSSFMMINRFNADGSRNFNFVWSGNVAISEDKIKSIALQSDGKVIIQIRSKGKGTVFLRISAANPWDSSFGFGGIATSPVAATSMVILPNDKIVLGGSFGPNIAVSRLNANGTMDETFDDDGYAIFPITSQNCVGKSTAIQSDNKIVVGGNCSNGINNLAVFRFQETNFTE